MPDKRLAILVGHSHTGALVHAITRRPVGQPTGQDELYVAMFEAWKFQGDPPYVTGAADGSKRFNPAIFEAAGPYIHGFGRPIYVAMFGGNDWSVLSMVRHDRAFDFVLPEAAGLPLAADAEIVPVAYVRSILQALTDRYMYQLYQLRLASPDPVYAFVPPPPIGDNDFLFERLDPFFHANSREIVISPRSLRLKMWMLQRGILERLCNENGITVVGLPPGTTTTEGFLHPAFFGEDATHANPAYGELVLQQVEAVVGARLRTWYWFS